MSNYYVIVDIFYLNDYVDFSCSFHIIPHGTSPTIFLWYIPHGPIPLRKEHDMNIAT